MDQSTSPTSPSSPLSALKRAGLGILKDACATSLNLFMIMIPVIIVVKVLKELELVQYVALPLEPLMGLVGLPAEMGLVWATSMLNGLYGGMIVYASLIPDIPPLSVAQITVLCVIMLIAHNLLVEGRIAQKCGTSFLGQTVIRIVAALVCGLILHAVFQGFSLYQEPARAIWNPKATDPSLWGWALGEIKNLGSIFLIVLAIMTLMRVLGALRITDLFVYLLKPVLRLMGIGKSAATITIIGLTMGIAYGGGLIIHETKSGRVDKADVFPSMTLMGLSHALIEDTLIMSLLGAHMVGTFWARLVFSLLAMVVFMRFLAFYRSRRATA